MEQMTKQMIKHLLARIHAMQEKVVPHHEEMIAEMRAW
jgi:hypothetical protein